MQPCCARKNFKCKGIMGPLHAISGLSYPHIMLHAISGLSYPHIMLHAISGLSYPHIMLHAISGLSYPHIMLHAISSLSHLKLHATVSCSKVASRTIVLYSPEHLSCPLSQVLQDKERLVKRSQLKRSVYRVLGKREEAEDGSHDSHLRSHDEEIYDEDDFYHQVCKMVGECCPPQVMLFFLTLFLLPPSLCLLFLLPPLSTFLCLYFYSPSSTYVPLSLFFPVTIVSC